MDPMPHISFRTLQPRSRIRDQSSSAFSALTKSTTKVPMPSMKPRRLSTLTPKWPSSDIIEFLSAPSALRSESLICQTLKFSINSETSWSKASCWQETSVVWPCIVFSVIDATLKIFSIAMITIYHNIDQAQLRFYDGRAPRARYGGP